MSQPIVDTADPRIPVVGEYAGFFERYISEVRGQDLDAVLQDQRERLSRLPAMVTGERETFRYAPDKWSIRQVVGHLGDGERVFGFRALCFSRGEQAALPGFDENVYVERAGFETRTLPDLVAEWVALRDANLRMFGGLPQEAWARSGVANGHPITVRALAWVVAGHVAHHLGILRDRYGVAA